MTIDDGTCQYPPLPEPGCTDPYATNYDPQAGWNDGSCKYTNGFAFFGCMDPNATNYDPSASQDNGKCTYEQAELPEGFPSNVPVGTYTMICNGQNGGYISNTDIIQFSQELVSWLESTSAQFASHCSGLRATCSYTLTYTPWNGTFFTMTYTTIVTACNGDQCSTVSNPITCSIEATK